LKSLSSVIIEITNTTQNKMKDYDDIRSLKNSFEVENNKMKNMINELTQENQYLKRESEDNKNIKDNESNSESYLVARMNGKISNLKQR
jgi:hypothetical protein